VAGSDVGTYAFTLGDLSAGLNYTLHLPAAPATFAITAKSIVVTPDPGQGKVYGSADPSPLTYTLAVGALESGDHITGLLGRVAGSDVGTYAFTLGDLSAGLNYTLHLPAAPATFAIGKAVLTVTANDKTITEGDSTPIFSVSYSGFVNGDSALSLGGGPTFTFAGIAPTTYASSTTPPASPGTYSITPGGLPNGNYSYDYKPGTFTINTAVNYPPSISSFTATNANLLVGPMVFPKATPTATTFTTVFTDPNPFDSWAETFIGGPSGSSASPTTTAGQPTQHTFVVPYTFTTAGCRTVTATVTDHGGLFDSKGLAVGVGSGDFLPPMTDQSVTDELKNGQVLPVKVRIANCNGPITGLNPSIVLKVGDATDGVSDDSLTTIVPDSVSAADVNGVMRQASDGTYIYNMKVNATPAQVSAGTVFTIVVTPNIFGYPSQTLRHKILPRK
jgi:hypothetical protein